jgi:hypothetical protein
VALLPLTLSDVDVGVTVVKTETARVVLGFAAVGVGCESAAVGATRGLAVPAVSCAAEIDAGADASPGFPLLLLLL